MLHEIKCLVQCLVHKCSVNVTQFIFYSTQLQVENTILNTCLSAPRLRNKRSQKDFSSQSSKMTLVIRISGSCHAGGKLIKSQLVSTTSPFTIPAKHRIWKDLIQRMAENYREENRCGEWVQEREGSLKLYVQYPHLSSSTPTY